MIFFEENHGHIYQEAYDLLSDKKKQELHSLIGTPCGSDEGWMIFDCPDMNKQHAASSIVKKYLKHHDWHEQRAAYDLLDSEGTYHPSDIDAIFEIQGGRCYFTGAPISKKNKNYSIDHLTPVSSNGSSWPGNLVLVRKEVNTDKNAMTKEQYWKLLERKKGEAFVANRKVICAEINKKRGLIDRRRKKEVKEQLAGLEKQLMDRFPSADISLELSNGSPSLCVNGISVEFSPGTLRKQKSYWRNASYLTTLIEALTNKAKGSGPPEKIRSD